MFTARDLKELMEARPFVPFKIFMSDGRRLQVPNHDAAFVTRNFVEVGLELDADGFAEHVTSCSILHITGIEKLAKKLRKK